MKDTKAPFCYLHLLYIVYVSFKWKSNAKGVQDPFLCDPAEEPV